MAKSKQGKKEQGKKKAKLTVEEARALFVSRFGGVKHEKIPPKLAQAMQFGRERRSRALQVAKVAAAVCKARAMRAQGFRPGKDYRRVRDSHRFKLLGKVNSQLKGVTKGRATKKRELRKRKDKKGFPELDRGKRKKSDPGKEEKKSRPTTIEASSLSMPEKGEFSQIEKKRVRSGSQSGGKRAKGVEKSLSLLREMGGT